jgi:hypothetical protein
MLDQKILLLNQTGYASLSISPETQSEMDSVLSLFRKGRINLLEPNFIGEYILVVSRTAPDDDEYDIDSAERIYR